MSLLMHPSRYYHALIPIRFPFKSVAFSNICFLFLHYIFAHFATFSSFFQDEYIIERQLGEFLQ